MDNMLLDIDKMFQRPSEAVRVLQSNVDTVGTVVSMISIIQAGFLERRDPYITNLLSLFRINVLKDLKKKAKIIVPKGAYLLGVMDETGTLEEGEVFVQIYNNTYNNAHKEIITGEVVVFRNPCFHPGDVRVVKAVDRPNLHHLIDVVVFSSKGFRDIPSMCSGGDLDGDDYTVYWDPKLIPEKKNFTPMDYTAAPPKLVQDVKIRDIIKFFVNYINYDNLGQIANAHLATADQSVNGARDGKCILLAQLHSEAVDFPKSGKPAQLTDDLIVKAFPDFMQKKDKDTYESKKVLGRIFRAIDKSNYKDYQSHLTEEAVYDPRLRVPDMELYIKEARESKILYNRDLSSLMNQFGVQTEAEICSGYVIKWLKKGKSKTRYEQHDATMKQVQAFKLSWKRQFEKEFLDSSKKLDLTQRAKIEAKAAAWYYVTYHPVERQRDSSLEGGFLSFPWSIYDYICEMAKRNMHKKIDDPALSAAFDEETILEGDKKLQLERGNAPLVYDEDDEDEDDEDYDADDYETDSSSDYEVITYNAPSRGVGGIGGGSSAAAAAAASASGENTLVNTSSVINPTHYHPLEPHQSIVGADATMDDLSRILFGTP
ncbi:RNA dependent RNA polymerase-domain-containing protein [Pilaira anomala]|nr:RNA dependent RNA polymerase-domain-containing protein [Pilaira anomala]